MAKRFKGSCPSCPTTEFYYCSDHDAFYCNTCDIWLEKQCSDEYCQDCSSRPEKPSLVVMIRNGGWFPEKCDMHDHSK